MAKKKKAGEIRIPAPKPKKQRAISKPVLKPKRLNPPQKLFEPVEKIDIPPDIKKGDIVIPPEPKPHREKAKSVPVGRKKTKKKRR